MNLSEFIHPIQNLNKLSQDGILLLNSKGKIDFVNTSFNLLTGYTATDLKGKDIGSVFTIEKPIDLITRLKKDKISILDLSLRHKNKKSSRTRVCFSLLEFDEEIIGFMVIMQNRIPSDEIHKYQLKKNPILRAINTRKDLVWMVADALSGHYLFCSDSFLEITGWHPQDFAEGGRAFSFSIFHPDDRERCFKLIADWSLKTNQKKLIYNHLPLLIHFKLKGKKGDWLNMVGEANVLERDPAGNVNLILWSFRKVNPEYAVSEKKATNENIQDLVKFIDGKPFVNLNFLKQLQDKTRTEKSQKQMPVNIGLTERELEILKLIANGLSSEEIADKIFISKHTVNLHRKQIMKKMEARNLAELVRKSIQYGLA